MFEILIAVLIVAAVGLIAGIILSAASVALSVPVDQKQLDIRECLPGANCGACGFSGCDGYASALADGSAQNGLCTPGGQDTAEKISLILGTESTEVTPKIAVIKCKGDCLSTQKAIIYQGSQTCATANQLFLGGGNCSYSCIGFGDCVSVCEENAIVIENGIAKIISENCKGCGKCVNTCPKSIIELANINTAFVGCSSKDKGAVTRKKCSNGCIGCMLCVKACDAGAVSVTNNLAYINTNLCTQCGKCIAACKMNCISPAFICS